MKKTLIKIITIIGTSALLSCGCSNISDSKVTLGGVSKTATSSVSSINEVKTSYLPKETIVDTPFCKMGKVYDCGCIDYILNVYYSWY